MSTCQTTSGAAGTSTVVSIVKGCARCQSAAPTRVTSSRADSDPGPSPSAHGRAVDALLVARSRPHGRTPGARPEERPTSSTRGAGRRRGKLAVPRTRCRLARRWRHRGRSSRPGGCRRVGPLVQDGLQLQVVTQRERCHEPLEHFSAGGCLTPPERRAWPEEVGGSLPPVPPRRRGGDQGGRSRSAPKMKKACAKFYRC